MNRPFAVKATTKSIENKSRIPDSALDLLDKQLDQARTFGWRKMARIETGVSELHHRWTAPKPFSFRREMLATLPQSARFCVSLPAARPFAGRSDSGNEGS